jgi:hypothetical protein
MPALDAVHRVNISAKAGGKVNSNDLEDIFYPGIHLVIVAVGWSV